MKIWTLDFETFFSDEFTLKKYTVEEYIRDPRFEALLLGVRTPEGVYHWIEQDAIGKYLSTIDWSTNAILCHHAQFDGLILSHHYGVRPAVWLDTLSMARLQLGNHISAALGSLTKHYGLPDKSVPYGSFKGRRWAELPHDLRERLGDGCVHDVELTWQIFQKLMAGFPAEELRAISMTVKMFSEPQLEANAPVLETLQRDEIARKESLLFELGVTKKDIGSNEVFIRLLQNEGVEACYKPGKNGPIPAFAKNDDFMQELLTDENERVATLAEARLACKSTIEETRAGRILSAGSRGSLPIYLSAFGARSLRWSGGDRTNWQNLKKGSALRKGLKAPDGHMVAVVDQSQVECRLLNTVAGQESVVQAFREGRDVYCELGPGLWGRKITKADKAERDACKTTELSSGYGVGDKRLGFIFKVKGIKADPWVAIHKAYRPSHPFVVQMWGNAGELIPVLKDGGMREHPFGWPIAIDKHRIILPNGSPLHYSIMWDEDNREWLMRTRTGWQKIFGGALTGHIIQALARLSVSQAFMRIEQRTSLLPKLAVHDEGAWLPRAHEAEAFLKIAIEEMRRSPVWLPHAPLDAEGGISTIYGEIK